MQKIKTVTLYTDGACSGNPGAGGWACVLEYQGVQKQMSGGAAETTNNQMELMAVIVGLEAIKKPAEVNIISDSKYVVDAFNNNWIEGWIKKGWKTAGKTPVKNVDLWQRLLHAKSQHDVTFTWVKGHAGHEYNERCDFLAVSAYKSENLLEKI